MENRKLAGLFFAGGVIFLFMFAFVVGFVIYRQQERTDAGIARLSDEVRHFQEQALLLTNQLNALQQVERNHELLGQLLQRLNQEKNVIEKLEKENRELKEKKNTRTRAAPTEERPVFFDFEQYKFPPEMWTRPELFPKPWEK